MENNIIFANNNQSIIWTTIDPDAPKDDLGWISRKGIAHSYVSYREVGQLSWSRWFTSRLPWSTETETIFYSNPGFFGMWSWVYPVQYIGENGAYEIKLISEDADGFRCSEMTSDSEREPRRKQTGTNQTAGFNLQSPAEKAEAQP